MSTEDLGDYDVESEPGPLDDLIYAPPWRDQLGWHWEEHRGSLRCHLQYGRPYDPVSRTGRRLTYRGAMKEWEQSRAGGSLWDAETADQYEWRNRARKRTMREARLRLRKVRVRGLSAAPAGLRVPQVSVVGGRMVVR